MIYLNPILKKENVFQAKELLSRASSLGCSDSMITLGILYLEGKEVECNIDKAIDLFERSLSCDSENPSAILNLALAYIEKGLTDKAVKLLRKNLYLKPLIL